MLHARPIKQASNAHTLIGMIDMAHHTYLDSDPLVTTKAYSPANLLATCILRNRSHFVVLSMVNVDVIPFPLYQPGVSFVGALSGRQYHFHIRYQSDGAAKYHTIPVNSRL
jgi:hypothetical protein